MTTTEPKQMRTYSNGVYKFDYEPSPLELLAEKFSEKLNVKLKDVDVIEITGRQILRRFFYSTGRSLDIVYDAFPKTKIDFKNFKSNSYSALFVHFFEGFVLGDESLSIKYRSFLLNVVCKEENNERVYYVKTIKSEKDTTQLGESLNEAKEILFTKEKLEDLFDFITSFLET